MRGTIAIVLLAVSIGLVFGGRAMFRARRARQREDARIREQEFMRANSTRRPHQ